MGFGQTTHSVEVKVSASSAAAAKKKAELLAKIGSKANEESLAILAKLSVKPNVNSLLKEYESILDSL